jgi:hypothetical protein
MGKAENLHRNCHTLLLATFKNVEVPPPLEYGGRMLVGQNSIILLFYYKGA